MIVMIKGKKKKVKIREIYSLCSHPFPLRTGGGDCCNPPPTNVFHDKHFKKFFIDTWVSGQGVGKLNAWQS